MRMPSKARYSDRPTYPESDFEISKASEDDSEGRADSEEDSGEDSPVVKKKTKGFTDENRS